MALIGNRKTRQNDAALAENTKALL